MLDLYLFQLLNGLGLGMIYFLIAVGLTIIFGLLNFVNFAHGAFFLLGLPVLHRRGHHRQLLAGAADAPLVVAALAWAVERLLIKRIYHLPHTFQILVTLGIALIIQEASVLIWGPVGKNIAVPPELRGVLIVGDFIYPYYRLFLIGFAALIGLGLWLLLERTRFGALVRAGSESTETVSLLGTNIFRLFSLTFALGVGLAGVAGCCSPRCAAPSPSSARKSSALPSWWW
jgi:branched-chain amino acid transport system permease protein